MFLERFQDKAPGTVWLALAIAAGLHLAVYQSISPKSASKRAVATWQPIAVVDWSPSLPPLDESADQPQTHPVEQDRGERASANRIRAHLQEVAPAPAPSALSARAPTPDFDPDKKIPAVAPIEDNAGSFEMPLSSATFSDSGQSHASGDADKGGGTFGGKFGTGTIGDQGRPTTGPRLLAASHQCSDLFPFDAKHDHGVVTVELDIAPDGRATAIDLPPRDSGSEFALAARICAKRLRFEPARDEEGIFVQGRTTLRLHFERSPSSRDT